MTTNEVLDKIAQNEGFNDWTHLLIYEEGYTANITSCVQKAMQLYAQQFIDCANDIIGPACDEEYEKWHEIQEINEIKT